MDGTLGLTMRLAETGFDPTLVEALGELSRGERVAYVLQRLEGLTAEETRVLWAGMAHERRRGDQVR